MQQTLSLKGIKAAIFDMDGTMVNNMPFHKKAWHEFCDQHNIRMTENEFKEKISGKKNDEIFKILFNKSLSSSELSAYIEEKEAIYREIYAPAIKPVDGLVETINELETHGIKLAIATTAPIKNREFVLRALDLSHTFPVILGDEDTTKGKPDPEIYLKTAGKLELNPSQCIAFEDSPPGVESAKSAGMTVVGILTTHSKEELHKADLFVQDYTELSFTD